MKANRTRPAPLYLLSLRNLTTVIRRVLSVSLWLLALLAATGAMSAATLYVPNGSFESPTTQFVDNHIGSWQKTPKPAWYDESGGFLWDQLFGVFINAPADNASHIDNCTGQQAVYLFAVPTVGLFQDDASLSGTNTTPSHEFNAQFEVGKSYRVSAGIIGGGGGMTNGATLLFGLYYRDGSGNQVTVAATNIVYSQETFPTTTHFIDFTVEVPGVKPTDAWAGQPIGIQLLSTVDARLAGGYWDIDNIRLTSAIEIPNASFESPETPYVDTHIASWQKTPKPFWFDESGGFFWDQLTGVFLNAPATNSSYIDNLVGRQAAYLFAVPTAGLFQDYDSVSGTNTAPSHEFFARFQPGREYRLSAGILGGGGGMTNGASLLLSLYYRDLDGNPVTVSATNIVYTPEDFPTTTHFSTVELPVPAIKSGEPWAGRHIGVQIYSTVAPNLAGGYWDIDHLQLTDSVAPALTAPVLSAGALTFNVVSEPGLAFEIWTTPTLEPASANWTNLGSVTNVTGSTPFSDPNATGNQRFYQLRQKP